MSNEYKPLKREKRAKVWAKSDGLCWYCGKQTNPFEDFVVDHAHPRSQGGSDKLENLVPACMWCNNQKGGKTVKEYRHYLTWKGIEFSEAQIEYLGLNGITVPEPKRHVFWYEKQEAWADLVNELPY